MAEKFLKFEILSKGLRISELVRMDLGRNIKEPLTVRSGLSSGLDIILPNEVWVNAPIDEWFTKSSPFLLDIEEEKYIIKKNNEKVAIIEIINRPAYYEQYTSDGTLMKNIGSTRADRISIGVNNNCIFWNNEKLRCKFCAIGHNTREELSIKTTAQIIEVIEKSMKDPILPSKHVYLNAGALGGLDQGIKMLANVVEEIKNNFNVNIHLNPCPPKLTKYIDILYNKGLDEVSFNLEIFDQKISKYIIPGKYSNISPINCIKMLEYAVNVFGERNVSSCLVVGLEEPDSSIKGVDLLSSIGVIPKLSIFRPLTGSLLEKHPTPSPELLIYVYKKAKELTDNYGIPLGPLCKPCQLHSLIIPKER
ncbi:MAG: hypothetical protein JSV09_10645 [Thermoplasmata archaeon]|nr:MAG: hypothetical protein JSV09_10645 [Thermoplasmata archaeon]